jgi:TonB family protein
MSPVEVLKRVVPFAAGLTLGLLPVYIFSSSDAVSSASVAEPVVVKSRTSCWTKGGGAYRSKSESAPRILSKPAAAYTESARIAETGGTVLLEVTFLASGEIGDIRPVKELPQGLTEAAIEAARKIKFRPAMSDGKPVTSVKTIEYTFSVY